MATPVLPKKARMSPGGRAMVRKAISEDMGSADTTGMDPAMANTLRQEAGRRAKFSIPGRAVARGTNDGEGFLKKVFSVFHPKGK